MLPGWLYPLSLVALAVLIAVEPAFESRGWAILLGIFTPAFMFVSMQLVIERGRDADVLAGSSAILIACMIAFTGFRPGLLAVDFLIDDVGERPHIRYRIWSGWVGIAVGIVLATWYAVQMSA